MIYFRPVENNVDVYDTEGKKAETITLPYIFSLPVRKDLIRRAFLSSLTKSIQPKGRDPMAGKRTSAKSMGIGLGIARVPRIAGGEAALAPNTVGGRLAFPPTLDERIEERINFKEKRLAIASALSACSIPELVKARGHKFTSSSLPLVVADEVTGLNKSKQIEDFLRKLGVGEDLDRVREGKRVRPGKGKMRGRRYKIPRGPLIVVHDHSAPLKRAAENLPGVDVISAKLLSVIHLAPGGSPGRLTIFTKSSLKILEERLKEVVIAP